MPIRSKPAAKLDPSQPEITSQRRTKRLRIDSDEDEDEGYEQQQERRTSYNESYTRGGPSSTSPGAPVALKRQKLVPPGPDDGGDDEYDARVRDYNEPDGDEYEGIESKDGHGDGGNHRHDGTARPLGKKRRRSVSSPLSSLMDSSPPPTVAIAPSSLGGRTRKVSLKAKHMTSMSTPVPAAKTKSSSSTKGKQKAQPSASSSKRKRRQDEDEDEEEEYQDFEDEEVDIEEEKEETRFSDGYDDNEDELPSRGKRGRKGGKPREREKDKDQDTIPILKRAKFEGNPEVAGSTITSKQTRTKKLAGEDSLVDFADETPTPEPSSTGSPAPANLTIEAAKDDNTSSNVPSQKKRKLPTIRKLKNSVSLGGGTGPSTPSATVATGSKLPGLPPPPPGVAAGNGANKLGIVDSSKSTRPKTNATTDLDLSNPSLYAELFKNPSGSASRTGLNRRAKEEERRKELDKMRDEYKTRFAEEAKLSFDLQGQAEKMAKFEETLRRRHSSALYPNFLGAKWREEWEREKRRAHKREYQQPSQQNGNNSAKEEGEM